ncbi:unnamed protein product [Paramecium sonneborni]|uniref:Uncharacterized protein n=1 Tax=Paramecium sonneborni TaxID=65129 RepID=A0A8S1KXR3_9CILI|nr:unnamed protein product [Paramecium sonneborni]
MNNIQGYSLSKPSTKTSQAPGGNSSISFGQYEPVPQLQKRTVRDSNASHFTLGRDDQQWQEQGFINILQYYYIGSQTSVKVKNPPGGKSTIQFG